MQVADCWCQLLLRHGTLLAAPAHAALPHLPPRLAELGTGGRGVTFPFSCCCSWYACCLIVYKLSPRAIFGLSSAGGKTRSRSHSTLLHLLLLSFLSLLPAGPLLPGPVGQTCGLQVTTPSVCGCCWITLALTIDPSYNFPFISGCLIASVLNFKF